MSSVNIRKIDIDSLSSNDDGPPSWAKIDAVVNGVPIKLTLGAEQTERLLETAHPIVMELVAQIADAMDRKIVEMKRGPAA